MSYEQIKLAYAVSYSSGISGYIGAVLITDYKGFPLEFRYTDPIVPTKIQQVLYGKGLDKYIKIDVVMDSLIKVLSNKVDMILVNDEDLLDFHSEDTAIVRISATKSTPLSNAGDLAEVKKSEYLLQVSHSNNPLRLQFSRSFNCEGEKFDSIISTLTEAGSFIDIDEPLDRVFKTIELICNQEV
jgi:hypothetical protein